jgi:hypothetical protein
MTGTAEAAGVLLLHTGKCLDAVFEFGATYYGIARK